MELITTKNSALAPINTDQLSNDVRTEVRDAFDAIIAAHDDEWHRGMVRVRAHIFTKRAELIPNIQQWLTAAYTDGDHQDY